MTVANAAVPTPESQMARIFDWRLGFNAIHVLDLGVRLGLFAALAETPATAAQLAERLGLQPHHVGVWCRTAYGLEVLEADDADVYRLADHYDTILANPKSPRYLGAFLRLATDVATEDFRHSAEIFRTGEPMPFQGRGTDFARAVADSTLGLQILVLKRVLPGLPGLVDRLSAGGTVLEIGSGAGTLLIQIAKQFPEARLVGVEIDDASAAESRTRIAAAGHADRVTVDEEGVAHAVAERSVDLCLMVQVLHEIADPIRPDVVKAAGRALKPGGWMVILDETYPETLAEMRDPDFRFPLQTGFEELTWGNIIPTRAEQERLLRGAGLTGPIGRELVSGRFTVLTIQA